MDIEQRYALPTDDRSAIRKVLIHQWDPIGLKDRPSDHQQYDLYIERIWELLLLDGAPMEVIADHLYRIECQEMGLERHEEIRHDLCCRVAEELAALRRQLRKRIDPLGSDYRS